MFYNSNAPMVGLMFDCETSGSSFTEPSSKNHQAISFGLIAYNTRTFEAIDDLYVEIKFNEMRYKWDEGAERCHGLSRGHLAANGLEPEAAVITIGEWLLKNFGPSPTLLMSGHNVNFDVEFLRQLFNDFEMQLKTHHVTIDTAALFFPIIGSYKADDIFDFCGFEKRGSHNALEDAYLTLLAVQFYRDLFKVALS